MARGSPSRWIPLPTVIAPPNAGGLSELATDYHLDHGLIGLVDQFTWRHPEWWALLAALGAWIAMAAYAVGGDSGVVATPHHPGPSAGGPGAGIVLTFYSSVAMMLPLAVMPIRSIAFSNFRYRTDRSLAMFVVAYLGVWVVTSTLIAAGVAATASVVGSPATVAVALVFAAIWQRTYTKLRALRRCDPLVALAPHGWRADRQHFGLGLKIGRSCVLNCWALMTLAYALGHHPVIMLALLVFLVRERYGRWAFWLVARAISREVRWALADARSFLAAR